FREIPAEESEVPMRPWGPTSEYLARSFLNTIIRKRSGLFRPFAMPDNFRRREPHAGELGNQGPRIAAAVKTPRTAQLPPFDTQGIGSLPRPQVVRDLLARRHEMDLRRLRGVLDDLVRFAIRLQEQAGLDVVSDDEWRRVQYIREFLYHNVD